MAKWDHIMAKWGAQVDTSFAPELVNDFGFSFHGPKELEVIQPDKVRTLMVLIQPLLDNLKKNPDKDYIYWPNRVAVIEEFEKKLKELTG